MKVKDQAAWDHIVEINGDSYGSCAIRYAVRWAELMEAAMSAGEPLRDCAKRTSHEADTEGITLFQYGAAVSELAQHWVDGEELRWWHNSSVQLHDEGERANEAGGVLNPAVLNVSPATDEDRYVPDDDIAEDRT